tara:strand:- start:129 stop:446 length:318 start_codon:yes stop_codon:yes gene_type:complete
MKNNKYKSILKEIDNKFKNKNFEFILSNLTLEELIHAKLELSSRSLNEKFYGYPIFKNIQHIAKESLVKFALNFCDTKERACSMLGLNRSQFIKYIKKHNLKVEE